MSKEATRPVRPLSPAAKLALADIGEGWQKVPHHIKASHIAVLIRQGHIEHRWPFDLWKRFAVGHVPWLREGEIRRRLSTTASDAKPPEGQQV